MSLFKKLLPDIVAVINFFVLLVAFFFMLHARRRIFVRAGTGGGDAVAWGAEEIE